MAFVHGSINFQWVNEWAKKKGVYLSGAHLFEGSFLTTASCVRCVCVSAGSKKSKVKGQERYPALPATWLIELWKLLCSTGGCRGMFFLVGRTQGK